MDIKSAVLNQLVNVNSLCSLILQNHIYGCFILMEDIAQKKFEINGTVLSTPKFTFDYDKQFSDIGIRYGFAMDSKLKLELNTEYKDAWVTYFNNITNIEDVDKLEDSLIDIIQKTIKPEDAFFVNALETGSLPQEWIDVLLNLVNPKDDEPEKNAISMAITEKPIRRLSTTRRIRPPKKILRKTRRNR